MCMGYDSYEIRPVVEYFRRSGDIFCERYDCCDTATRAASDYLKRNPADEAKVYWKLYLADSENGRAFSLANFDTKRGCVIFYCLLSGSQHVVDAEDPDAEFHLPLGGVDYAEYEERSAG